MDNLADREKLAKKGALVRGLLDLHYILHGLETPPDFRKRVKEVADKMLSDLEWVETDFWNKYEEAREMSRD